MILTHADLRKLTTRGSRRLILAELTAMGIHYELGLDGWPRVLQAHVEEVLRGKDAKRERRTEPNFEELGA